MSETTIEFFNSRADRWDENHTEQNTNKLEAMADRLSLTPGSTILDVGTGTGVFLPYLLKRIGPEGKAVALDNADRMLEKAKAKNPGPNVEFLNADVMDIPLDGPMFDSVVCYSTFPHFEDKVAALKEIGRVMKPGGKVIVCHTSSRDHINRIHNSMTEVHGHTLPDCGEMAGLLAEAGFVSILAEEDDESYFASAVKP